MIIVKIYARLLRSLFLLLALLVAAPQAALADNPETYFMPMEDNDLFNKFEDIQSAATQPLLSFFSMVITTSGTIIYWDHWENGYETDIFNPTVPCTNGKPPESATDNHCTQIWGDEKPDNGCAPIIAHAGSGAIENPCLTASDDLLARGDVAITNARIPIPRVTTGPCDLNINAFPSAQGYCYDGKDKIVATFPLVATRSAFPSSPGTLFAAAAEVAGRIGYAGAGDSFIAPVGQSTSSDAMFQDTSIWLMAGEDGVTVNGVLASCAIDGSAVTFPATLAQGVGMRCDNIDAGDSLAITAGSAQAHLITADDGATYEMRWFQMPPRSQWSQQYYAPVGTADSAGGCTAVWLYSDAGSAVDVAFDLKGVVQAAITIPAGGGPVKSPRIQPAGAAARFTANQDFIAISTTDCDGGLTHDWGHPLMPTNLLTTEVVAGFAKGCTNNCLDTSGDEPNSRSPLWVTPVPPQDTDTTMIYVDYDGIGAFCDSNKDVQGDVGVFTANFGDSIKIFDDQTPCEQDSPPPGPTGRNGRECDNDMTGAHVFTCSTHKIAAVWGLDPARSGSGDSDGLDMGALVFPIGAADLRCNSMIADSADPLFPTFVSIDGDDDARTVKYTINIENTTISAEVFTQQNLRLADDFPPNPAFVVEEPDPTQYTPYCLDAAAMTGLAPISGDTGNDGVMNPGESWVYECYARIKSGLSAGQRVVNTVSAEALVPNGGGAIAQQTNACEAPVTLYDPDLAVLSGFHAYVTGDGVLLEWRTSIEAGTLGFHLELKNAAGEFERLNAEMLPAVLRSQSGVYRYRHGGASAGMELTYRLLEVQNNDSTRTIGEFTVTPGGKAPKLLRKAKAVAKGARGVPRNNAAMSAAASETAPAAGFVSEVLIDPRAAKRAERARASKQAMKARHKRARRAQASKQARKARRKAGAIESGKSTQESIE